MWTRFWFQQLLVLVIVGSAAGLHRKTVDDIKDDLESLFDELSGDIAQFVRLSWHDSGTYDVEDDTGGSYACQRLTRCGEGVDPENAGLDIPIELLDEIHAKYERHISVADLWALAAGTAIEYAGGPDIGFNYGRKDCARCEDGYPDRLPHADSSQLLVPEVQHEHLLDIFTRLGFEDPVEALVALSGAHSLGSCKLQNSGYDGVWTTTPQEFSNSFFINLFENTEKYQNETTRSGLRQLRNPDDDTIMLPSDMALLDTEDLMERVEEYSGDTVEFNEHFAYYYQKLQELHWEESGDLNGVPGLVLFEDFSDWNTNRDQWSEKSMETSTTSENGADGSEHSMMVIGSGDDLTASQGVFYKLEDPTEVASIECWFYQSDGDAQYDSGMHVLDEDDNVLIDIEIALSEFRLPGDFVDKRLGDLPPKSWAKVEVNFDWDSRTMDTAVIQEDGEVEINEDIPFRTSGAGDVEKVRFFHSTFGTTGGFDEFVVAGKAKGQSENDYPGTFIAGLALVWWGILLVCVGGCCLCICIIGCIYKSRKREPIEESTKV